MKKIILIISLAISIFAKDMSVLGFGDNETDAKKSAIKELSAQIEVNIHSNITTTKTVDADGHYGKDVVNTLNQTSVMKFLGLKWGKYEPLTKQIKLTLPTSSYHLYAKRLKEILDELSYYQDNVDKLKTDITKIKFYKKSQFLIYEYKLLEKVALYLRLDNLPKPKVPLKQLDTNISVKMDKLKANPTVKLIDEVFENVLVSNDFKVELKFKDRTKDDVVLYDKDEVALVIKSNKPTYYYLIESVTDKITNQTTNSLVQLNESDGIDKFIGYIGFDEIKKYVIIGEFEIGKPFGTTHLHLFASNKKFDNLPQAKENSDGLFIIQDKVAKTINNTRGLYLKKKKKSKQIFSEDYIDYDTRR
jgi:hypothetical protein